MQNFLTNKVESEVKKAAKAGKRYYYALTGSEEVWKCVDPTPLIKAVVDELKKLGYSAKFGAYGDNYVPRGLADDSGEGPIHTNYGILIGW